VSPTHVDGYCSWTRSAARPGRRRRRRPGQARPGPRGSLPGRRRKLSRRVLSRLPRDGHHDAAPRCFRARMSSSSSSHSFHLDRRTKYVPEVQLAAVPPSTARHSVRRALHTRACAACVSRRHRDKECCLLPRRYSYFIRRLSVCLSVNSLT